MTAQSRPPLLLLTRPEAQARRFLAKLPQDVVAQVQPQIAPLLRIVPEKIDTLDPCAGVILTSENAVHALTDHEVTGLTAYCVGPQTAKVAQGLGMQVRVFGENADDLVAGLIRHGHRHARAVQDGDDLARLVREQTSPGDMVVCLGAGTISAWAKELPDRLKARKGAAA